MTVDVAAVVCQLATVSDNVTQTSIGNQASDSDATAECEPPNCQGVYIGVNTASVSSNLQSVWDLLVVQHGGQLT